MIKHLKLGIFLILQSAFCITEEVFYRVVSGEVENSTINFRLLDDMPR